MSAAGEWMRSIAAAAVLLAVLRVLIPQGTIEKIGSFTGGLIMIVVLLRPWISLERDWQSPDFRSFSESAAARQEELETLHAQEWQILTAERTETLIEQKALETGAEIHAEIGMQTRDGVPSPWTVKLVGDWNGVVSDWIASEIGIPKARQEWITPVRIIPED